MIYSPTYLLFSLFFLLLLVVLQHFLVLCALGLCAPLTKSLLASMGESDNNASIDLHYVKERGSCASHTCCIILT